jgi:hypothetical protein
MDEYMVIRKVRVSVDKPAGVIEYCNEAKEVSNFLWGKDVENYLVIKNGDAVALSNGNLSEIEEYLECFVPESI